MVFLGLIIAGYQCYKNRPVPYQFAENAQDGGYVMPEVAYREMMKNMESKYFRIQINARPELSAGRCNLMIGNPVENEADAYVILTLDETGEEIFCSEILKPGERAAYVNLNHKLETGEHAATATFVVLGEDGEEEGAVQAGIIITVP